MKQEVYLHFKDNPRVVTKVNSCIKSIYLYFYNVPIELIGYKYKLTCYSSDNKEVFSKETFFPKIIHEKDINAGKVKEIEVKFIISKIIKPFKARLEWRK